MQTHSYSSASKWTRTAHKAYRHTDYVC